MPEMTPPEAAEIIERGDCGQCRYDAENTAIRLLRAIAAGEYKQVVHAQWEEVNPGHDILFECSNCGRIISTSWGCCEDEDTKGNNGCDPTDEWLCCPSCGALMGGKDDDS